MTQNKMAGPSTGKHQGRSEEPKRNQERKGFNETGGF